MMRRGTDERQLFVGACVIVVLSFCDLSRGMRSSQCSAGSGGGARRAARRAC